MWVRVPLEEMYFSWKRFHVLQNTIDFVTKVGLWLRLHKIVGYLRKAGGSLLAAHCSLAVACCFLLVSEKWGHNSYILLYFQFPELKIHNQ